jgi:CRISPR system Cascade subunit CasE
VSETWCESLVTLCPDRARALSAFPPGFVAAGPAAAHRLIWSLFGDTAERRRDFLFRVLDEKPLRAVVRSARPPADRQGLWTIARRPFAPRLMEGQRLRFRVSAVPSVQTSRPDRANSRRRSLVLDLPRELSAEARREHAEAAAIGWLEAQGGRHGFDLIEARLVDIERVGIAREGAKPILLGTAQFEGRLAVTGPEAFGRLLHQGLGPNRAFGYGLVEVAPDDPRTGQAP